MLFKFGKIFSSLCSFRKTNDAIPVRLLMEKSNLSENSLLMNHLLVIFKYYPYNAREYGNLSNELLNCLYL